MKVKITVEYEVEPGKELNSKEQSNVVGMLMRMTRNRLMALRGRMLGGEQARTGWEVKVKEISMEPVTKS